PKTVSSSNVDLEQCSSGSSGSNHLKQQIARPCPTRRTSTGEIFRCPLGARLPTRRHGKPPAALLFSRSFALDSFESPPRRQPTKRARRASCPLPVQSSLAPPVVGK